MTTTQAGRDEENDVEWPSGAIVVAAGSDWWWWGPADERGKQG